MDKELKAKWVAALRSGQYKQARHTLNNAAGGYCCLGVLLDVSRMGDWRGSSYELETDEGAVIYCDGDLGSRGRSAVGLGTNHEAILVKMNDGVEEFTFSAKCFPEIADWIEANL